MYRERVKEHVDHAALPGDVRRLHLLDSRSRCRRRRFPDIGTCLWCDAEHIAEIAVGLSVCPSVCPLRFDVVPKQLKIPWKFFDSLQKLCYRWNGARQD